MHLFVLSEIDHSIGTFSIRFYVLLTIKRILIHALQKTARAVTKLTNAPSRPLLASRPFHASPWSPAQAPVPTPASKAANMAEDASIKGPPPKRNGVIDRMTAGLRELMPGAADQYVAYGVTQELYNECVNQAAHIEGVEFSESAKFWYEG